MLPWVCLREGCRRHQNVETSSVAHLAVHLMPLFLFLSILMLSVVFQPQCKFCWGVHEQTSIKNKN